MIIEPKEFVLKDGRTCTLRTPETSDAPALLKYLVDTAAETDYVLSYPEERAGMTLEKEERFIASRRDDPDTAMISAFVDGELAGNCEISFLSHIKDRHRAVVAIALYKKYWNLGIGNAMFEEMIRLAESREGVLQMELEVIEGNRRAIALYEKNGFHITSVHPNAIRLKDGTMLSEYLMIKEI